MLYYLSMYLTPYWGPFRLLQSHALLLAGGTFTAAILTWLLLPRLWRFLPRDHGKAILKDMGGMQSAGKPTGTGLVVTLVALPVILLFAPLAPWDAAAVAALYAAMLFGYLDDRAAVPWGELRKGLLDAVVSFAIALFIFLGHSEVFDGSHVMVAWLPFVKGSVMVNDVGVWLVPGWAYVPVATALLWFTMNATNCSDGVDGLAGTLTVITLAMLAVVLYVVVGYRPVAHYFLIPVYAEAARWAIVVMIVAGAFGGYLWYNAEPSKVLMGDAGSRFLGILVATASLMTGNPLFVLFLSPIVLVNGGGGLGKLVLLRVAKRVGFQIGDESVIRKVRFPLHDHCKKNLGWSNAQVLMRFVLLQLIVMPILLIILIKVR
ncbi:MAG: phospho-N-acetylmuramoyl-pentapeptide-transferase [Kiritimatiellae bacterium]|nr:phospho-N-acetylmuramoyl-pentapeptide-transferase [Kiritimatiellia bacterium]